MNINIDPLFEVKNHWFELRFSVSKSQFKSKIPLGLIERHKELSGFLLDLDFERTPMESIPSKRQHATHDAH